MIIATLDTDIQYTKKLGSALKSLLPDVEYKAFTSPSDCVNYASDHEVSLIFINQNIGMHFAALQTLHYKLRRIRPHVDIIIVYDENESNTNVALWSIQSRCSDYICKSDTMERLRDALRNIWFPFPKGSRKKPRRVHMGNVF